MFVDSLLQKKKKRCGEFLKKKNILNFLQDTHFTKKEANYIRSQWGFECFFSSFFSQSRGVAILFNNNFDYKLNNVQSDDDGNKLIVEISIQEKSLAVLIYMGQIGTLLNFTKVLID